MGISKRWTGFVAGFVLAAGVCLAQDQDDAVRRRLKEMKGNDNPAAMVAEMELVSMGDQAIGSLKKIIDDAKDADRAEAMRVYPLALEKAGRLTRVTLDFEGVRAPDLLKELNKQSKRVEIEADTGVNTRMTIHREKVSYGLALAEICQRVDGMLNYDFKSGKTMLWVDPGSRNRPISEEWGNMVILNSANWSNEMFFDGMRRIRPNLELDFNILVDPSMQSYFGRGFREIEATDESGRALAHNPIGSFEYNLYARVSGGVFGDGGVRGGVSGGLSLSRGLLLPSPEPVKKLTKLKGKKLEYVGDDFETWVIEDAAKAGGTQREFGPMKLEIRSAEIAGANWVLKAVLTGVPMPMGEAGAVSIQNFVNELLRNSLRFNSDGGKSPWTISSNSIHQDKESDSISAEFEVTLANVKGNPDLPVKLKVNLPRKFEEIQIGFEFKDIELF